MCITDWFKPPSFNSFQLDSSTYSSWPCAGLPTPPPLPGNIRHWYSLWCMICTADSDIKCSVTFVPAVRPHTFMRSWSEFQCRVGSLCLAYLTLSLELKGEAMGVINTENRSNYGLKVTEIWMWFLYTYIACYFPGVFRSQVRAHYCEQQLYLSASSYPSVCPSVRKGLGFDIPIFFENLLKKFKFHWNLTRIAGTFYEDLCTFITISRGIDIRMGNSRAKL
jgi:hypothetical protein